MSWPKHAYTRDYCFPTNYLRASFGRRSRSTRMGEMMTYGETASTHDFQPIVWSIIKTVRSIIRIDWNLYFQDTFYTGEFCATYAVYIYTFVQKSLKLKKQRYCIRDREKSSGWTCRFSYRVVKNTKIQRWLKNVYRSGDEANYIRWTYKKNATSSKRIERNIYTSSLSNNCTGMFNAPMFVTVFVI